VAGGRELWAIPKGLADIQRSGNQATVDVDGRRAASLTASVGRRLLPGWQSFTLTTAQKLEGRTALATNAARVHARRARIQWDFPADGPLAYMREGRPLMGFELDRMGISFGLSVQRS
jgi:acetoacetate decarboxylase